jgi:hypothetical protein
MQFTGGASAYATYAREVGSTDSALKENHDQGYIPGFLLGVDGDNNVEFSMGAANSRSWIFGYVEEYVKRSRSKVTEIKGGRE